MAVGRRHKTQGPSPSKTFPGVSMEGLPWVERPDSTFCNFCTTSWKGSLSSELLHTLAHHIPCKGGEEESWSSWTIATCTPSMVTWQFFESLRFFCPSWALRIIFQVAACVYSTGLLENLRKEKNQQIVVMRMENHMLHKTAYVLCLRCTGRYAKINTCQLPNLPILETSESLCTYAKNTAWLKCHRLLKLKTGRAHSRLAHSDSYGEQTVV